MGFLKDVFDPKGAEKERKDKLMRKKRKIYPKLTFNISKWKNTPSVKKIKQCQDLSTKVNELRLLKSGKADDSALSDGFRVDTRTRDVYSEILKEYKEVLEKRSCENVIDKVTLSQDRLKLSQEADETQARIEKDLSEQRTIIIAVGGVILILGTILIIRKL